MTPLVKEMVSLSVEVAVDFHWFDITSCYQDSVEIDPNTLELKLPFQKSALVWQQPDGLKALALCVQGEYGAVVSGYVMSETKYDKIDTFAYLVKDGQTRVQKQNGQMFSHLTDAREVAFIGMICAFLISLQTEPIQTYIPSKTSSHDKRVRKGKKPLYDWKTILIEPPKPKGPNQGGTHASPRWHERRGHWRTTRSGKKVWVKNCEVGDKSKGAVFHDYQI